MSDGQLQAERSVKSDTASAIEWPTAEAFYLTLDFECDFGTALDTNTYQAVSRVDQLISVLEAMSIPLTCFVQTELLDVRPEVVEQLRRSDVPVRFHPHSHTHRPRERTSVQEEIQLSTERFIDFFGTRPTGYRFPNGNVRDQDYRVLASAGYEFDASVIPTWRPGHFNKTRASTSPTYFDEFDLVELPFSILSPYAPIPTGLSYVRVFGRLYLERLLSSPPEPVVFNIHMHDLYTPTTLRDLPRVYRTLYSRNDHGFELLRRVLTRVARAGYSFGTLDEAHAQLRDRLELRSAALP